MIRTCAACVAVVVLAGADGSPAEGVREAYREAKVAVGPGADAQVRLALWCEAHGLEAERIRHLGIAVMTDPANATARGLLGLVEYRGKWARPDDVAARVKSDVELAAALAEYNARRARLRNRADDQFELALWCESRGLRPEAIAHFTNVTRLDPTRESAWKHLGFKKYNGKWLSESRIAAVQAEAGAQRQADRRWRPLLERWLGWLGEKARRAEAEARLAEVSDPRAVPAIWAVFGSGNSAQQRVAAGLLAQVNGAAASRALVALVARGKSPEVRRAAAQVLARRDPREFTDALIDLVRRPLKFEVKPVGGPGSPGVLFVEGERYNVRRIYTTPTNPAIPFLPNRLFASNMPYDPVASQQALMAGPFPFGFAATTGTPAGSPAHAGAGGGRGANNAMVPNLWQAALRRDAQIAQAVQTNIQTAQQEAAIAQGQLQNDIAAIEAVNADIRDVDSVAIPLLKDVTGEDRGDDPKAWRRWWTDRKGYAVMTDDGPEIKPTYTDLVALPIPRLNYHSCFAGGTPVRTLDGLHPIESVRVGDRVVVQDAETGALGFRPVVAVYHNQPNATLSVKFPGEDVVATGIHRFWKAGKGWVMARDLKPGDEVRTLDGMAKVVSVGPDQVQRVYNLEVADGHSFFVGRAGMLVHDNSLVEPTPAPFDAPPVLVAKAPAPLK
ncbi:MAG TPA: polymorphic toxin-type HINT domain-containing protein [Isosphaeraceae bacterium]